MIKITREENLIDYEFGPQAAGNRDLFTDEELETLENILMEVYPDGIDEYELEDLFRFDFNHLCDLLGLNKNEVLARE